MPAKITSNTTKQLSAAIPAKEVYAALKTLGVPIPDDAKNFRTSVNGEDLNIHWTEIEIVKPPEEPKKPAAPAVATPKKADDK